MAHIQHKDGKRLKNGKWIARYRAPDGRERSKSFDHKSDAERFLNEIEGTKYRHDRRREQAWLITQIEKSDDAEPVLL